VELSRLVKPLTARLDATLASHAYTAWIGWDKCSDNWLIFSQATTHFSRYDKHVGSGKGTVRRRRHTRTSKEAIHCSRTR